MRFHLRHATVKAQTYFEHFKDSIQCSWRSMKASFYFLVHAFSPDNCTTSGSKDIEIIIQDKYAMV